MVYSASADYSYQVYGSPSYIFMRQLRWLGLGSFAMIVLAFDGLSLVEETCPAPDGSDNICPGGSADHSGYTLGVGAQLVPGINPAFGIGEIWDCYLSFSMAAQPA